MFKTRNNLRWNLLQETPTEYTEVRAFHPLQEI